MQYLPREVELVRQQIREERRIAIQRHLGSEVEVVAAEAKLGRYAEWEQFRSQLCSGDQIKEFDTVESSGSAGFVSGERGYAVVREGVVVSWIVTEIDA